ALIIEGKESPYANLIAVREGDEKKEDIQKLVKALQSEKVKVFIENTHKGGVVPAF
ncbi:MAG: MetQ/NlpA family ABC transporter substrate-binding protein, partial [Cetobacterium sp.]